MSAEPTGIPAAGRTGDGTARTDGTAGTDGTLCADRAWQRLLHVRTAQQAEKAGLVRAEDGTWRWRERATHEAARLASLYTPLCLAGTHCAFAQLGQSLDGFIATRTGHANYVTGEEDRLHLHRMRALADAVLVGAGTTIADDPRLTVRACTGANPVRVVLDPRGRTWEQSRSSQVFTDGQAPTLRLVGPGTATATATPTGGSNAPGSQVEVLEVPRDEKGFDPRLVLEALARRGLRRVMVEGGGATVSGFLRADVLHRLYVTVAPVLVGDGVPGLRFPGPVRMGEALRPPTRVFPLGPDVLFELDLRGS